MELSAEELAELRGVFATECSEHVEALNGLFLELEEQPQEPAALAESFRRIHSIKGAARSIGLGGIEAVAHAMEAVLAKVRDGATTLTPPLIQALFEGVDLVADIMHDARADAGDQPRTQDFVDKIKTIEAGVDKRAAGGASAAAPSAVAANPAPATVTELRAAAGTVRVSADKIDRLIALRGELLRELLSEEQDLGAMHSLLSEAERDLRELRRQLTSGSPNVEDYADEAARQYERMEEVVARLDERNVARLRLLEELLHGLAALRMLPARTILQGMPRVVRDVAQSQGKRAELLILGADVQIDKAILDALQEPLIHLVRNAVAHGIETPGARRAAGKAETGVVRISITTGIASATVTVEDDGAGIDVDRLRARAVSGGFIAREAATTIPDSHLLGLLFKPGFSTAMAADAISGRGVGLDVVANRVSQLRGSYRVESSHGRGARFVLNLPVSLLTSAVLIVRAGDLRACIRQTDVREAVLLKADDVITIDNRAMATVRSEIIPVASLGIFAGRAGGVTFGAGGILPAIIIEHDDVRAAFVVDQLAGIADVIVKSLPEPLGQQPGIAGCAMLTDGTPVCVLDGEYVVAMAHNRSLASAVMLEEPPAKRTLLLVEDSMTTRILLRNIMQSAGYEVETAVDGTDAWKKLQQRIYDCVMSDIQMPNMDGWELLTRMKGSERLADVPVVLVTALANDAERRKGLEFGADAYIVKGMFNENELLQTVERLVA